MSALLADDRGLGGLGSLYAHRGPFVSVYLDLRGGPDAVDARWAGLRAGLARDGAGVDLLDAAEEAIVAAGEAAGLVALAAEGRLCLAGALTRRPAVSTGSVSPLPVVLPWLREREDSARAAALASGWSRRRARHGRRVSGAPAVVAALRVAQVQTLVLAERAGADRRCWVGPRPTEFGLRDAEAARLGVSAPGCDRLDSALVRAAYATRAEIVVAPDLDAPDGMGAVLRDDAHR